MNIALIGYGRMGQAIAKLTSKQEINISLIVDPSHKKTNASSIEELNFDDIDVAIDFSHPETAINNIKQLAEKKINIIMGTTGWYDQMEDVKKIIKQADIGFLWASNFSIGVHLFWQIIAQAGKTINHFSEYDVFGHEWHHKDKKDSPSGTAISTANILIKHMNRKEKYVTDKLDRKPESNELHFSSTRGGNIPGTHAIYFDSPADTIEIKHTARSRDGFALGALQCAKWLAGKTGFYSIDDYLKQNFK